MKLELKRIAFYLPYGLDFLCFDVESKEFEELPLLSINLRNEELEIGGMDIPIDELPYPNGLTIKPILRPLSDLTKEIEETEKTLLDKIVFESNRHCDAYEEWLEHYIDTNDESCIEQAPFEIIQELFKLHFDVFGLIQQGLAIDINTLES